MDLENLIIHFSAQARKALFPLNKTIQTIPVDASQHQIEWDPDMKEQDYNNVGPLTRLSKKKSSIMSIKDIHPSIIKPLDENDLLRRTSNISNIEFSNQINNMYNLDKGNDNFDSQLERILSSNPKITKSIPRRPQITIGKSLSGFSNISNSNDFGNRNSQLQAENSNLFKNFQGSLNLVKIPMEDLSRFDADEKLMENILDIPIISSRGNSFQNLMKNDSTPALFRGSSSIMDQKNSRKNF